MHVLHVDDDSTFLKNSKLILESENKFRVDVATSVNEAFYKLKTQHYDAVISDCGMPQKDVLDFLKELRKQKNEVVFIIFTDQGREEVVIGAINLGADYFIDKRGSPEKVYCELTNAIRNIVRRKKEERSL